MLANRDSSTVLLQKKIWFELVYKAFPKMGLQKQYSIRLDELRELIGWYDLTSNDTKLKVALNGLNKIAVQWNIFGKDKKKHGNLFLC